MTSQALKVFRYRDTNFANIEFRVYSMRYITKMYTPIGLQWGDEIVIKTTCITCTSNQS